MKKEKKQERTKITCDICFNYRSKYSNVKRHQSSGRCKLRKCPKCKIVTFPHNEAFRAHLLKVEKMTLAQVEELIKEVNNQPNIKKDALNNETNVQEALVFSDGFTHSSSSSSSLEQFPQVKWPILSVSQLSPDEANHKIENVAPNHLTAHSEEGEEKEVEESPKTIAPPADEHLVTTITEVEEREEMQKTVTEEVEVEMSLYSKASSTSPKDPEVTEEFPKIQSSSSLLYECEKSSVTKVNKNKKRKQQSQSSVAFNKEKEKVLIEPEVSSIKRRLRDKSTIKLPLRYRFDFII